MDGGWTPNLSWVAPDLAVGGAFPPGHAARLKREHGVGAVIDARSEACDDAAELAACDLWFLHLPAVDLQAHGRRQFDQAVAFAKDARGDGRRLLIHCQHGIGRSATLALCVLVSRGLDPLAALRQAKDTRALVSPSPSQYQAWTAWLGRRVPEASIPSFEVFKAIAYRHLSARA